MVESCTLHTLNVETYKGLSTLKNVCGTNSTQFMKYITFCTEHNAEGAFVFKQKFIDYYKERYNEEPDILNGSSIKIKNAIMSFYKTGINVNSEYSDTNSSVAKSKRYTTSSARKEAKAYTAGLILNIDANLMSNLPYKNMQAYLKHATIKAYEIAKEIIDKSTLDYQRKLVAKANLSRVKTIEEIRRILANNGLNSNFSIELRTRNYYKRAATDSIKSTLIERIANKTGESIEAVRQRFKNKNLTYDDIRNMLGGDNISIIDQNYLALWDEVTNDNDNFFKELFERSDLKDFKDLEQDDTNDKNEKEAVDEDNADLTEDEQNDSSQDDDYENTAVAMFDHSGIFKTAMTHVNPTCRSYLGKLKKLNSTSLIDGKPDYNLDNALGVPVGMDVNECCTMLYHMGSYENPQAMIDGIRRIANNYRDFAAFEILANDLEANEALRNLFYDTFGKLTITKTKITYNKGVFDFDISNKRSNKLMCLQAEFMNSIKHTCIDNIDIAYYKKLLNELESDIKGSESVINKSKNGTIKKDIVNRLIKLIKSYYPTANEYAIENYINKNKSSNGNISYTANINNLLKIMQNTIKAQEGTLAAYNKHRKDYEGARAYNRNIRNIINLIVQNHGLDEEEVHEQLKLKGNAYIDEMLPAIAKDLHLNGDFNYRTLEKVYASEFITAEQKLHANELASILVNYQNVSVDINSTNVYGNQSSDVINSSFITNLLNILKDEASLKAFGKYKAQSKQYNFSNILFEDKDENGDIIYGLFRKDADGNVTPTEYARQLLSVHLFDGAIDYSTDKKILYKEMSEGDYIGSQFISFFQGSNISQSNIPLANYFMRTPSDAPRNFVVTAPRYKIQGLINTNESQVSAFIDDRINQIKHYQKTDDEILIEPIVSVKNADYIISAINSELKKDVKIPAGIAKELKQYEGQQISIKFQYKTDDKESDENIIVRTGIYSNGVLKDSSFAGTYIHKFSDDVLYELRRIERNDMERKGKINHTFNSSHILFRQLKKQFKQELLDAAIALDSLFETYDNGVIVRANDEAAKKAQLEGKVVERGDIVWKQNVTKDGRKIAGCYDNYHHKKGKIVDTKNDKEVLVGNVFHSTKFKVYGIHKTEDGLSDKKYDRNFGEELMQRVLNPLYGGFDESNIRVDKVNGVIVDVNTEKIDAEIDKMISDFMEDLIRNTLNRLDVIENLNIGVDLSYNNVADFMINYAAMYMNFDDLFEGDSKFYKDSQTFLKRAKEVQGSGTPYSMSDIRTMFEEDNVHKVASILDTLTFGSGTNTRKFEMRNKFKGVTIKNTIKTGETIGEFERDSKGELKKDKNGNYKFTKIGILSDKLITIFENQGYSKKDAEIKAANLMAGYADTTINDAQSYITFEEWVRRVNARGQIYKYKDIIDKIVSGQQLNGQELSEFIQVQKNFYYDQHYDRHAKIIAPRQIKNAEFVLVPQLIKGTELEVVYNLMRKHDIDQLNTEETSKAGKTNTLEIFDAKTGNVKQDIIDEINGGPLSQFSQDLDAKDAIEYYNYANLYTQQETPQHLNARNKAAIQIMKKIIDNINPGDDLYPIKQKFMQLYSQNIIDSALDYLKEIGIQSDDEGNILFEDDELYGKVPKGLRGKSLEKFYDLVKEELQRRGENSNLLDYATIDPLTKDTRNPRPIMPEYMSLVSQTIESVAQSLVNSRITRQKLPGFHAAQITNVGFKALATSEDKVSYSGDLRYHPDGEPYIEIKLAANAFGFNRYNRDGSLKPLGVIEENGKPTPGSLLEELQNEGLDEIIGYRIPTEGKQSIAIMKVVGFIDDGYGSTIVVPDDWVSQTGSDFDIDSVYGIQYNTFIDSEGHIRKVGYSNISGRSYENYIESTMTDAEREELKDIKNFMYDAYAESKGLLTREEYSKENSQDVIKDNSKKARENEMLKCMLDILSSKDSLEEILSRSNFDGIKDALDVIMPKNSEARQEREARSPYNPIDQAAYQQDAMSGAKLKAISVMNDTTASIANTVHFNLVKFNQVKVAYSTKKVTEENAKKHYDKVDKQGGKIIVTHSKFGWSKDNKNIIDKLLTPYTSQTTAHQLDAIKTGAIPNVNDYTFNVYKLLPSIGVDFDTTLAFIAQPGVSRIVNQYKLINSVYARSYGNPINKAIRALADELNIDNRSYANIEDLLDRLEEVYGNDFRKIWGSDVIIGNSDVNCYNLVIDEESLLDRLTSPVGRNESNNDKLYDLGIILLFNKLYKTADYITQLSQCLRSDKIGAKQSIYATEDILNKCFNVATTDVIVDDNGKSIIESIYPGLITIDENKQRKLDLENFLTTNNLSKSSYPPAYCFMKYTTGLSTYINKSLFRTQSMSFKAILNTLDTLNNGDRKRSIKADKAFTKYIINSLFNRSTLTLPVGFDGNSEEYNDKTLNEIRDEERSRIFGYNRTPDSKMIVNGEEVPFNIEDPTKPTNEDIEHFKALTPAQKVAYLQRNSVDAGIISKLSTNIYNSAELAGRRAGMQTITYTDTNLDIEDAYDEFSKIWNSENPLIKLTAIDLLKYAFIVEGYSLSKTGISKIIPNECLYDFVNEIDSMMNDLSFLSSEGMLDMAINFARGNSNLMSISSHNVDNDSNGNPELERFGDVIVLHLSEQNMNLANKYGIHNEDNKYHPYNQLVKLKFRGDDREILYKIEIRNNGEFAPFAYLYPLNPLESTENANFSVNNDYHEFPSAEYYLNLLNDYSKNHPVFYNDSFRKHARETSDANYRAKTNQYFNNDSSIQFDVMNPTEDIYGVSNVIRERVSEVWGNDNSLNHISYVINNSLTKYIKKSGEDYSVPQTIIINQGTKHEKFVGVDIWKLQREIVKTCINPYLANKKLEIKTEHKEYEPIIEHIRKNNPTLLSINDPVFMITPLKRRDARMSDIKSASDVGFEVYGTIKNRSERNNDQTAINVIESFKSKEIKYTKKSVNDNIDSVIKKGAEYLESTVLELERRIDNFVQFPDGSFLSINDPRVIDYIKDNESEQNRFLEIINDAEAIVNNNKSITTLNIDSQDDEIRPYLRRIRDAISKLSGNVAIGEAKILFATGALSAYSTNPLIQKDLINVFDGFYRTNTMNAWFSDMAETSNPFLQLVIKNINNRIFAKDKLAKQRQLEYFKEIKRRFDEASKAGHPINMNHIFDEVGRTIQNFDYKLRDKRDELKDNITASRTKYDTATDPIEKHNAYKQYLIDKLLYDEFLTEHIERPLVKEYYQQRNLIERGILLGFNNNDDGTFFGNEEEQEHSDVYVAYKMLQERRFDILDQKRKGNFSPELQEELDKIDKQIEDIRAPKGLDPFYDFEEEYAAADTPLKQLNFKIYNPIAQRAINNYINAVTNLNEQYFEYDPEFGFDEELKKNLRIIDQYEQRDPNGNLSTPMSILVEKPDYVKAKLWLAENAMFVIDPDIKERLNKAFGELKTTSNNNYRSREKYHMIIRDKKLRDEKGVVDATKLTDEEIAEIKEEQVGEYEYGNDQTKSDRSLMSFSIHNGIVYTAEFYENLTTDGTINPEWMATIREINAIISKYWDRSTQTIDWSINSIDEQISDFKKLQGLYDRLTTLKRKNDTTNGQAVRKFIDENVNTELTPEEQELFNIEEKIAIGKGQRYYDAWRRANTIDGKPNNYLYHNLTPKAEVADRYIDKKKTEALKTINEIYVTTPSEYYYQKRSEMREQGEEAFNKWYEENHIYNPYKHCIEPIRCWMVNSYNDDVKKTSNWVPKRSKTTKAIKQEYENPNYVPNVGHLLNYKTGTGYDNPLTKDITQYEKDLSIYIQNLLYTLVRSDKDRAYIAKGYIPYQRKSKEKDAKFYGQEILKTLGWQSTYTGRDSFDEIDYGKDRIMSMPMLQLLDQKRLKDINIIKPIRQENESDEDFAKRMNKYNEDVKKLKEDNRKAHEDAINKNFLDVIGEFILQAGHYNAVEDCAQLIYYAKSVINNYQVYKRKFGFFGDLKYDSRSSEEGTPDYIMETDANVAQQWDNYARRILFNQFKESNASFTKWAARLQNLTSAQYMMMNIRGGIANVTLGKTQILAEAYAKELIDIKSWAKSDGIYMSAIPSFLANLDKDTSSSVADGIIKWFNVIDYDENTGRSRILEDSSVKAFTNFRSAMYSPQTIGEHLMQNRALIAMLLSHKIYIENGKLTYKNRGEVLRDCAEKALKSMLTDAQLQQYNEYIENIKADANKMKDFSWFRADFVNSFAKQIFGKDYDKLREYNNIREQFEKKELAEFEDGEKHPDVYSQLGLNEDGYMEIKKDSLLANYDSNETLMMLSDLRNRVISVNKKIHGVYDKLGQAQLERKWFGSLVMQYHKHIPIGINKRFRSEGYFNESRSTIEKGAYISLYDFLATPFKKDKYKLGLTDQEAEAAEGFKNVIKNIIDFLTHIGLYWNLLPEHEKANIRRNLGDVTGILGAMFLIIALRAITDDDDEDGRLYNLALYEADRLLSESLQFNPIGAYNEAKKLWSTPIAAQSGIQDLFQSVGLLTKMIMQGDEFDPYYHSGRFAGEHKLSVYIQRRIPVWRGIKTGFIDIVESNQYYKLGSYPVIDNVLDWAEGEN